MNPLSTFAAANCSALANGDMTFLAATFACIAILLHVILANLALAVTLLDIVALLFAFIFVKF